MVVSAVVGGGPDEWVWAAIAAGDVAAVRAAHASFDANGIHPKYGSVLTAFLQALLNLEGRFIVEPNRGKRAKELVEELGRRGARPDLVIPAACVEVKGLYRDWHLTGDVTAMQAVIQMRNDLLLYRFQCMAAAEDEAEGAAGDAEVLSELIDRYAELVAQVRDSAPRSFIPRAVVDVWEQCLQDRDSADVELVTPNGRIQAHSLLLSRASPVVAAMLNSGMQEGRTRTVVLQEPTRTVELFLTLLYTGCLPAEPDASPEGPELSVGLRVVVKTAFVSNSARNMLLPTGLGGEVQMLDTTGDALVRFDGVTIRQWVSKKNFGRLRVAGAQGSGRLQEDLAGVLSLLHRWQVVDLSEVVAERLERDLSVESFACTLEAAALHGVPRLRAACLAFARNCAQVRTAYDAGDFGPAARAALDPIYSGSPKKRARKVI